MKVELINNPTLVYSDWAIGECYDKGCYTDPEKMKTRINKVANVNKHSSVLEFTDYIFEITASNSIIKIITEPLIGIKYISIHQVDTNIVNIKINARTIFEVPLPYYIYDAIPDEFMFLSGYKPVYKFKNYVISKNGDVYRTFKSKKHDYAILPHKMRYFINKHGYKEFILSSDGERKHKSLHRLLMETYYTNDINEHVNHKDGNKLNNSLENLEWCTASENEQHSYKTLGKQIWNKGLDSKNNPISKPIEQFTKDGEFIAWFPSAKDAIKDLSKHGIKLSSGALSETLNGKHKQHKGFVWKFA